MSTKTGAPKTSDPKAEAEELIDTRTQAEKDEEAQADDNQDALRSARWNSRPLPFMVTEQDMECYQSYRRGLTLEEVIREELDTWPNGDSWNDPDWDRAVWHGPKLVAVIRLGADGKPEALRLDGKRPRVVR